MDTPLLTFSLTFFFKHVGAPNYNMFSTPVATVNPVSVSSGSGFANSPSQNNSRFPSHSATSSSSGYQPQSNTNASDSAFGDFDFVSNTGAPSGPTTGTINILFLFFYWLSHTSLPQHVLLTTQSLATSQRFSGTAEQEWTSD